MRALRNLASSIGKQIVRVLSFFFKEIWAVIRQPRLVLSVVLGPFLILAAFGLGFKGQTPELYTLLILPSDPQIADDPTAYQDLFVAPFILEGVTRDRGAADQYLQGGRNRVAVIAPEQAEQRILSGEHAQFEVVFNETDPLQAAWVRYFSTVAVQEINKKLLAEFARSGQQEASEVRQRGSLLRLSPELDRQVDIVTTMPPEVLAAPFSVQARNVVAVEPTAIGFFTPAVIALLLQHMAVSLASLSMVRDRLLGATEVYRVAPIGAMEVILGKSLSYGLLLSIVAAVLVALCHYLLGVPILGDVRWIVLSLGILLFASLGFGFLLSVLATSETQAVQLAMLVLLASIFFGGFFLALSTLAPPVRAIGYVLPVTFGSIDLREVMLRGAAPEPIMLLAPLALGVVLYAIASWSFARQMATQ